MKYENAYEACDGLRQSDEWVPLPIVLFWQSVRNEYRWTMFARNGKIIGASWVGFSTRKRAYNNFDLCCDNGWHAKIRDI